MHRLSAVSFGDSENMKAAAPTAVIALRRNTFTFSDTWSPTAVVSDARRDSSSPGDVASKKAVSCTSSARSRRSRRRTRSRASAIVKAHPRRPVKIAAPTVTAVSCSSSARTAAPPSPPPLVSPLPIASMTRPTRPGATVDPAAATTRHAKPRPL